MIDVSAIIYGIKVYMTFFYGDSIVVHIDFVWKCLTLFSTIKDGSLFMIGDFKIIGHNEKEGGRRRSVSSFLPFKQMIADCGMLEFPCFGNLMSWVGKRGQSTVRYCHDRALGNENWHEKFLHSSVSYFRLWGSDHRPVLANILLKPFRVRRSLNLTKDGWIVRKYNK